MANLLITGGAGFIGGNFVHHWARQHPDDAITVLDCLTYAGNRSTIDSVEQADLVVGDIRDTALVENLLRDRGIATIVHFAAESHVDRSIIGPDAFIDTNILGTHSLLCVIGVLPVLGLLGMALGAGWIGVMFGFALQVSRGLSMSLFYEALNRRVPGHFRATVNSLVSLAVRAIFIGTGPLLGYALDRFGVTSTLFLLAAIFTPVIAVVLIPLVIRIRKEEASENPQVVPVN